MIAAWIRGEFRRVGSSGDHWRVFGRTARERAARGGRGYGIVGRLRSIYRESPARAEGGDTGWQVALDRSGTRRRRAGSPPRAGTVAGFARYRQLASVPEKSRVFSHIRPFSGIL